MKYRMQRDPDGAVWLLENERINMETRAYHEAAVEFWGEIERLRAVNAELLAACKDCLREIDDFAMVGSYPNIDERKGYAKWRAGIEAAIARAEQAEERP